MRRGFTMIELIFVIVIIGILAAIAIPKLSATRDDAKSVTAVQNLATCINDVGASYTANGSEGANNDFTKGFGYASCKNVSNDKCFTVDGVTAGANSDGNITVSTGGDLKDSAWCQAATADAAKKNLVGDGGTAKDHVFGGSKIKY